MSSARQKWDQRYIELKPAARRKPGAFVGRCLSRLPASGRALDVAAGAGRHSLALARLGWRVDAVDISWQGLRLARQRLLAAQPAARVNFVVANIERDWLPHTQYDLVLVTFFLHRPLFPLIKERLRPGGWLIYETYTVAQLQKPHNHRPTRPHFLLQPGELKRAFSDFEILFYDEDDHQGRATAQLLAQKP